MCRYVQYSLHCNTLHYNTLHYNTLPSTTFQYIAIHDTTLHSTTLHYTTLHFITTHHTTRHCTTLHYNGDAYHHTAVQGCTMGTYRYAYIHSNTWLNSRTLRDGVYRVCEYRDILSAQRLHRNTACEYMSIHKLHYVTPVYIAFICWCYKMYAGKKQWCIPRQNTCGYIVVRHVYLDVP